MLCVRFLLHTRAQWFFAFSLLDDGSPGRGTARAGLNGTFKPLTACGEYRQKCVAEAAYRLLPPPARMRAPLKPWEELKL